MFNCFKLLSKTKTLHFKNSTHIQIYIHCHIDRIKIVIQLEKKVFIKNFEEIKLASSSWDKILILRRSIEFYNILIQNINRKLNVIKFF